MNKKYISMLKTFLFIICSILYLSAQAQQVSLVKSTVSTAGGSYSLARSGLMLNQTIGQSSIIGHFSSGSVHLLQGFQHPYRQDFVSEQLPTQTLSVYPNPTSGIVTLDRSQTNEPKKIIEQLTVSLFNMAGKLIKEEVHQGNGSPIETDFSLVNKGVYLLKVAGKKSGLSSAIIILN